MTDDQKAAIDAMTRFELCRHWRYAPLGDPLLQGDTGAYFKSRMDGFGGFSPEISKAIGWGS